MSTDGSPPLALEKEPKVVLASTEKIKCFSCLRNIMVITPPKEDFLGQVMKKIGQYNLDNEPFFLW